MSEADSRSVRAVFEENRAGDKEGGWRRERCSELEG